MTPPSHPHGPLPLPHCSSFTPPPHPRPHCPSLSHHRASASVLFPLAIAMKRMDSGPLPESSSASPPPLPALPQDPHTSKGEQGPTSPRLPVESGTARPPFSSTAFSALSSTFSPAPCPAQRLTATDALESVRLALHPLLTDEDAARLLRVSRLFACRVLRHFTFRHHTFVAIDEAQLGRLRALYERFGLRVTRMVVSNGGSMTFSTSSRDSSPFPSSLVSLACVSEPWQSNEELLPNSLFGFNAPDCHHPSSIHPWSAAVSETDEERAERLCEEMRSAEGLCGWQDYTIVPVHASQRWPRTSHHIPPGLLPPGLRLMQLSTPLSFPLQPGSIPSSLEVLDLRSVDSQSLSGVLPPSLVHLMLGNGWKHPLPPGTLPPSLECLSIGHLYTQPLGVGCLPSSLRVLKLGNTFEPPSRDGLVLPHSLTHLSVWVLSAEVVLPPHLLSLALRGPTSPVLPLPPSLREFHVQNFSSFASQPGSLPEGLQLLQVGFGSFSLEEPPPPFELPRSLVALDLSAELPDALDCLVLPLGLRSLRCSRAFKKSFEQALERLTLPAVVVTWAGREDNLYENEVGERLGI